MGDLYLDLITFENSTGYFVVTHCRLKRKHYLNIL